MIFREPNVYYEKDSSMQNDLIARREAMMKRLLENPDKSGVEILKPISPIKRATQERLETDLLDPVNTQLKNLSDRLTGKHTGLKLNENETTDIRFSKDSIIISTKIDKTQIQNTPGQCTLVFYRPKPYQDKILEINFDFEPKAKLKYSTLGSEKCKFEICIKDFKDKPETKINRQIDEINGIIRDYLIGTLVYKLQGEIDKYIRRFIWELKYKK
ncbi:MAG: hypothetical protein WC356_06225 [Candidatus Micrarchaeia archaeon]|jgi:hypothetical protein